MMTTKKQDGCCAACGSVGRQPDVLRPAVVGGSQREPAAAAPLQRIQGLVNQRPLYVFGRAYERPLEDDGWLGQGTGAREAFALTPGQYIVTLGEDAVGDGSSRAWIRCGDRNVGEVAKTEMGDVPGSGVLIVADLLVGDVAEFTVTDDSNSYLTGIGEPASGAVCYLRVRRVDRADP